MRKKRLLLVGLAWAMAVVIAASALSAARAQGAAAGEIGRLAELMPIGAQGRGWGPGTVVEDIGAGDGKYAFAAVERVGASGKVYATEIDAKKLAELKSEVEKRKLANVVVVESKEADTNLPAGCCDAIFLRHVYHHLTKPAGFDARLGGALKPGGRVASIGFPPRGGLDPGGGVPGKPGGERVSAKSLVGERNGGGM